MAYKGERFHPMAIAILAIKAIRQYFTFFFFLFIFTTEILVFLGLPIVALLIALAHYYTMTYAIEEQRIMLRQGIIEKKETEVAYNRIQTVRKRQWFFFEPFDLVQVDLDTAGDSSGSEIALVAVPSRAYDEIKAAVDRAKTGDTRPLVSASESPPELEIKPLYRMSISDIVLTTATSQALIVGFFGVLAFVFQALPEGEDLDRLGEAVLAAGLMAIAITAFFGVSLIFAAVFIRNILLYYDFRLSATPEGLHITRGLLERHEQVIPYEKIRGIQISENLIRRPLKKSAVEVLLAGAIGEEEGQASKLFMCPIIDQAHLPQLLAEAVPDMPLPEVKAWNLPTKGRPFYLIRWPSLGVAFGLATILSYYVMDLEWGSVLAISGAIVTLISTIWLLQAWAKSHSQALATSPEGHIAFGTMSGFSRVRLLTQAQHIQATQFVTTPFLDRKGIHHLTIWLKTRLAYSMSLRFLPSGSSDAFPMRMEDLPKPVKVHFARGEQGPVVRAAQGIRRKVFIEEQGIDPSIELDDQDAQALHAVLSIGSRAVATVRFLPEEKENSVRLGRLAVLPEHRGQGYGRRLLEEAEKQLNIFGIQIISLHAQASAIGFYEALGYIAIGEPYLEAGISHQTMTKSLDTSPSS